MTALFRFAHHCIAHPLLFLTRDASWAVQLHDYTARRAWPEEHR